MPVTRDPTLPQHDFEQGHYGELPFGSLPSGTHTGQVMTYVSGVGAASTWAVDWPIRLQDEGTTRGRVYTLNFVGSNVVSTVSPSGVGTITVNSGGGSSLAVEEFDGSPSVSSVSTIRLSGGTVQDLGGGIALVTVNSGGGGGGSNLGSLLGYKSHTAGDEATSGSSLADVDATNAAVTFDAPVSGAVLVRLTSVVQPQQTAGSFISFGLRESTTDIAGAAGESIVARAAAATTPEWRAASIAFVLTGVSPGSHTYKWSWATSSGTANMKANSSAPAVMEVWSLDLAADAYKSMVTSNDTTPNYLYQKLSGTGNVQLYEYNDAGNELLVISGSGAAGLDLSSLTTERVLQGVTDYVAGYDVSAADERGFPVGTIRMGRGHTVIADDLFWVATTDVYEGGVSAFPSGAGAASSFVGVANNHPGVVTLSTGTTTTGRCALANPGNRVILGGGKVRYGVVARLETLSDGTQTYSVRIGLGDLHAGEHTNGVFFRYTHSVNSGEWEGVTRQASTETTVDTNVAADTNWHTFEAEVNAAITSVEFFIDGVSVGTSGSNVPSAGLGLSPGKIDKSAGSTARLLHIDAYWYILEFAR